MEDPSMQHASESGRNAAYGTESPRSGAPAPAGCVMLSPPHAVAPAALRGAFEKRGLTTIEARTRFEAMGAMLRAAERAGVLTGQAAGRGVVLVVVEPASHDDVGVDELLASVEKYLPRAVVRAYEAGAEPALRPIDRPSPEPEVVVRREAARAAESHLRNGTARPEPTLRLHRDEDAALPAEAHANADPDALDEVAENLLSAEELDMLLADDEAGEEGGRHR
jgi:hypothetical protein